MSVREASQRPGLDALDAPTDGERRIPRPGAAAAHGRAQDDDDVPELTLGDAEEDRPHPPRASFEITAENARPGQTARLGPVPPASAPEKPAPEARPALRITAGGQIGRYQLLEQIGEGGMATIFRARDSYFGRIVAVKALHAQQTQSLAGRRFQREYRAIHRLKHPNIVQMYEYGVEQGQPYIVMEYIPGHDLKQHLKHLRALPVEKRWLEVESLVGQICEALECIHKRGVIHRDLKPSNILISPDNRAKLTDFGVAKREDSSVQLTQAGMLVGTLAYLAPEVFEQSTIDHRVDLYALGVMLYVMLTDKLPFSGKTIVQLMQKHLTQTPEPPRKLNPAIPAHLEVITLKLLAKRPDDRYQSAAEVLRAIEAYRESARAQELTEQEGREQWLPRMVGRNGALSKVREAVTALVKGVGGVLWVEGPEGSGRSRLVEAGLAVAQSQGITVYTGRCLQGGQDWGEGFRAVLESIEAECARTHETFEELPRLREFFGQVDRPAPAVGPYPPEGAYEQDLANFFFHCCQKTPRIIWIEDLENADPGTLSGLAILAKRLVRQKVPLLLVGTFQTFQEPPTPLMRRLLSGELAGVTPQHVNLGPLEVRDVGQMLDAMFPRDSRVLPLAQRLIQESGGNPLIIVESLRLLMAQGRMGVRQGGGERRWAMSMSTEEIRDKLQWPRGTRALLLGRLAAYPQSTRTLLRLFAVWGREMRLRTLLRLASASEEAVLRHVERLLADGWLVEDWTSGEEGYLLAHPAYRSVLLSELTAVDQQRLRTFVEMRLGIKKATSAAPGTAPIR